MVKNERVKNKRKYNMKNELVYKINNQIIEETVKEIKFLGFTIDNKFKPNEHIDYICKKLLKNWFL